MALITRETAANMGRLSAISRRQKKERIQNAIQTGNGTTLPAELNDRIRQTELQLDKLDRMISIESDAGQLLKLVQAKDNLLNSWSLLTGFPKPGTRRTRGNSGATAVPIPVPTPSKPVQS